MGALYTLLRENTWNEMFYLVPCHCSVLDTRLGFSGAIQTTIRTKNRCNLQHILGDSHAHSEAHTWGGGYKKNYYFYIFIIFTLTCNNCTGYLHSDIKRESEGKLGDMVAMLMLKTVWERETRIARFYRRRWAWSKCFHELMFRDVSDAFYLCDEKSYIVNCALWWVSSPL